MKKTLLILGTGFIAKNLAEIYAKKFNLVIVGRSNHQDVKEFFNQYGKYIRLDSRLSGLKKKIFDAKTIICTIGKGSYFYVQQDPEKHFNNIIKITFSLSRELCNYNGSLIFLSSTTASLINKELKNSFYAISKNFFEKIIHSNFSERNKYFIFRLPTVVGKYNRKQLFWDIMKKFKKSQKKYYFLGTGNEMRNYCDIKDVANILIKFVKKRPQIQSGLYEIRSNQVLKVKKIIKKFAINLKKNINSITFSVQNNFVFNKLKHDKKVNVINLKKITPIDKSIKEYIYWFNKLDKI